MQDFKHPERFLALAKHCSDLPLEFLLIGPVADGNLDKLIRQRAESLTNLQLLGKQPPAKVKSILKESLLLVNTSDYEGFSNTFIEAWSQEVPVLSFHVDPDEIIKNYGLGWISSDLDQIKGIIAPLIKDQGLQKELGEKCKRFTNENFDIKEAVNKLEKHLLVNMKLVYILGLGTVDLHFYN